MPASKWLMSPQGLQERSASTSGDQSASSWAKWRMTLVSWVCSGAQGRSGLAYSLEDLEAQGAAARSGLVQARRRAVSAGTQPSHANGCHTGPAGVVYTKTVSPRVTDGRKSMTRCLSCSYCTSRVRASGGVGQPNHIVQEGPHGPPVLMEPRAKREPATSQKGSPLLHSGPSNCYREENTLDSPAN